MLLCMKCQKDNDFLIYSIVHQNYQIVTLTWLERYPTCEYPPAMKKEKKIIQTRQTNQSNLKGLAPPLPPEP